MRESALENWRDAVLSEEEHPFVDVMPEGTGEETPKKKSKKKEEEKEDKEDIKEASYEAAAAKVNAEREAKRKAADKRMTVTHADRKGNTPAWQRYKQGDKRHKMEELDLFSSIDTRFNLDEARARTPEEARAKLKAHREAMKSGGESPYFGKTKKDKPKQGPAPKDPWSTHAADAKAHRKEDKK